MTVSCLLDKLTIYWPLPPISTHVRPCVCAAVCPLHGWLYRFATVSAFCIAEDDDSSCHKDDHRLRRGITSNKAEPFRSIPEPNYHNQWR